MTFSERACILLVACLIPGVIAAGGFFLHGTLGI